MENGRFLPKIPSEVAGKNEPATLSDTRWWTGFDHQVFGVFEGGGAKGVAYSGALHALYERHTWFKGVAGASAGAITAVLVAAGYTPDEIDTLIPTALSGLKPKTSLGGILKLRGRGGYFDERPLRRLLESLLTAKVTGKQCQPPELESSVLERLSEFQRRLGVADGSGWAGSVFNGDPEPQFITFQELYEANGIELTIVAADITNRRLFAFNHIRTPNCQVTEAVLASAAIPMLFRSPRIQTFGHGARTCTMVDGGVWANYPDFVFNDPSFRSFSGLPPLGPESVVIGFVLEQDVAGNGGQSKSCVDETLQPMQERFIAQENDLLRSMAEFGGGFAIGARAMLFIASVLLFFGGTSVLVAAHVPFWAMANRQAWWWCVPLSIGVIGACVAGWNGKLSFPAHISASYSSLLPRIPRVFWGVSLISFLSAIVSGFIYGPPWPPMPNLGSTFASVFSWPPLMLGTVVSTFLLVRVIRALDTSLTWQEIPWAPKKWVWRLVLAASDGAAKLLHGPIGFLAFFMIVVGAVLSFTWLLTWWDGLATGQDDWSQTSWFYLRAFIAPALFVVAVLILALGLLLILNAILLNPGRRLGPDLLATLVAGAGAPEWAGFSEADYVVRIPVPDGLSTTSFDAPTVIIEEAKMRAHQATAELLLRIAWPQTLHSGDS